MSSPSGDVTAGSTRKTPKTEKRGWGQNCEQCVNAEPLLFGVAATHVTATTIKGDKLMDARPTSLSDFPITGKWPPQNPDVIQLYSLPTPNGIKASAMLEETGLAYEPHFINFGENEQLSPEFISLNPNNKIPAIIDPKGPDFGPVGLWETGAILIYLAEKTGQFLPTGTQRHETIQWLMWQMGGVGPMFGQFGFFHKFAGKEIEDKTSFNRYRDESKRLLGVLDKRLEGRTNIMGDEYTIADIATWPWVRTMSGFYEAADIVGMQDFANVNRWIETSAARPASLKAVNIPSRG